MNKFGNKTVEIQSAACHNMDVTTRTVWGVLVDAPQYTGIIYPFGDKIHTSQEFYTKISDFKYDIVQQAKVLKDKKWVDVKRIIRHLPNFPNEIFVGYNKNGEYKETPWNNNQYPTTCTKINADGIHVVFDYPLVKSAVISRLM